MRDWKLENLPNGKEISTVLFQTEKEYYLWRLVYNIQMDFPENYCSIWLSTKISGLFLFLGFTITILLLLTPWLPVLLVNLKSLFIYICIQLPKLTHGCQY